MKSIGLFLLIMCGWCANADADLYSALQYVYNENPVIDQERDTLRIAQADIKSATTGLQPYLGLVGNVGTARTKIDEYTFDYSTSQYGVEFQQNLFQGGANFAKIKGAQNKLAAQKANLYAVQQEVFLDAINAYIEVLNAQEVLKLNKSNQNVLTQYYKLVRDRQSIGMLTKTDVSQAYARLEMANYHLADAQAQYDNAQETFRRIYGRTESEYVEINLSSIMDLFPESIDAAQKDAVQNHPVLLALNAQEKAASQNIKVAYSSMLPSVDVRGSIQQIDDVPFLDDVRDSRIGVYLKVPLYDKGNALANTDITRANVAVIQDKIINARRVIYENLYRAWNIYSAQDVAIRAAKASIDANVRALDGIRDEQLNGKRTVLDVLNAEQELLNSRVAHARARHARISAFFSVLAAVGNLTPENLGLEIYEN